MAKLDLDPSLSQKVDAVRFASKFPGSSFNESEDPRKSMWEDLVKGREGAPAWSEVEPWLGNRAAAAVLPSASDPAKPVAVVVVAVSDDDKAASTLSRLKDVGVAVGDGWAYLSENAAESAAALAAARKGTLADDKTFSGDADDLGEDGIASAWFDGSRLVAFKKVFEGEGNLGRLATGTSSVDVSGHGALALRFTGTSLEVAGNFSGIQNSIPTSTSSGVEALPADTLAAIGVSGLGDQLVRSWPDINKAIGGDESSGPIAELEQQTGLRLPDDLKVLLGKSTAVAVGPAAAGGDPAVALRVQTATNAGGVLDKVTKLLEDSGTEFARRDFSGGYVLATTEKQAAAVASGKGLATSPRFVKAVPDAKKAGFVAYADVPGLIKAYGSSMSAEDRKELQPFDAVGMSLSRTGDDSFSVRIMVTTR